MRAKLIGGPLHGQSVFVHALKQGQLQSQHAFYRYDGTLYVHRMWIDPEGRYVLVLVDASLDLGEASEKIRQAMEPNATQLRRVA
jgi:hypothetical protein